MFIYIHVYSTLLNNSLLKVNIIEYNLYLSTIKILLHKVTKGLKVNQLKL